MHLGIFIAITESTIRIDELAREVEGRMMSHRSITAISSIPSSPSWGLQL
jgi:hypothetical protein